MGGVVVSPSLVLRSIIVPLDGSPFAETALPVAESVAARHRAAVELVRVYESPAAAGAVGDSEDAAREAAARSAASQYLADVAGALTARATVTVTHSLLEGAITDRLAAHVEARQPDLVVMTTHGWGGVSRMWFGSVADALIRRVSVPVLLLRPPSGEIGRSDPVRFAKVLVPVDGPPIGDQVLDVAVALAGEGAEYTLLHVMPPPAMLLPPAMAPMSSPADLEMMAAVHDPAILEAGAARLLLGMVTRFRARGLKVQTRVVGAPDVARAIIAFATEYQADLIAMTTRGYGGVKRLLLGSVADKVVRGSPGMVLLQRVPSGAAPERRPPLGGRDSDDE